MGFRIVMFIWMTFIGSICLKIYHDRNKDNIWGNLFRTFGEMKDWQETSKYSSFFSGEIVRALGWGAILFGLIILLFGGDRP